MLKSIKYGSFVILSAFLICSCNRRPGSRFTESDKIPAIDPDYSDITIPFNIAPLNFKINEPGNAFFVRISSGSSTGIGISSKNGIISIPQKKWRRMLSGNKGYDLDIQIFSRDKKGNWLKYVTIKDKVASESIDPYITYRLLYPGYESWKEISIMQRDLSGFKEWPVIENSIADQNCVNCHSYNNGHTNDFMFHVRGTLGGTCFYDGNGYRKVNLKTKEMKYGAVYPRWHPSGRFIAISSNKIVQQFHSALLKKVEVSDLESCIMLYNVETNEIKETKITGSENSMDTYPEWSPDGKYLYFCRAPKVGEVFDYRQVHYDLYRVPFDEALQKFGEAEMVFDASSLNKSVSFPRISPNGRYLVVTLHDYGCFPIWHKEADLFMIDLSTMKSSLMALNSDYTESYHSWSSNSRWLSFSSKRDDGLTARFYISHIDENGKADKPFILPQKDPEFYKRFLKSFNIPELSTLKINISPGKIRRSITSQAIQAKWSGN
jgi:hypothetical protein